jgi:hypothetical protein
VIMDGSIAFQVESLLSSCACEKRAPVDALVNSGAASTFHFLATYYECIQTWHGPSRIEERPGMRYVSRNVLRSEMTVVPQVIG